MWLAGAHTAGAKINGCRSAPSSSFPDGAPGCRLPPGGEPLAVSRPLRGRWGAGTSLAFRKQKAPPQPGCLCDGAAQAFPASVSPKEGPPAFSRPQCLSVLRRAVLLLAPPRPGLPQMPPWPPHKQRTPRPDLVRDQRGEHPHPTFCWGTGGGRRREDLGRPRPVSPPRQQDFPQESIPPPAPPPRDLPKVTAKPTPSRGGGGGRGRGGGELTTPLAPSPQLSSVQSGGNFRSHGVDETHLDCAWDTPVVPARDRGGVGEGRG